MKEDIVKISIKADKDIKCIKAMEDEGKYFVLIEITKEKYEKIKKKLLGEQQ